MDIILEKLKKCYGSHVALDIDQYTLTGGEIVGLVGNNGAPTHARLAESR